MEEPYIYISKIRLVAYLLLAVLLTIPVTAACVVLIIEERAYNRPIIEHIREVVVMEQHLPTNYFAPTGEWLSKGDPVALTPVKEK